MFQFTLKIVFFSILLSLKNPLMLNSVLFDPAVAPLASWVFIPFQHRKGRVKTEDVANEGKGGDNGKG